MLIASEQKLKELVSKARQATAVGIDTEFVWERTFYSQLGLIQLAIGQDCYLIDPVAIKDLSQLGELISDPSVTKILHDAQQDLTILKAATGAVPKNIYDTRLAYGFCSDSSTLSLSALLEKTLGIKLPKTETRANWLMRPLTDKMFEYACDDVKYSTKLLNYIMDSAEKQNTASWLKEELKIYDNASLYTEIAPYVSGHLKSVGCGQLK
jgi:ribonuclease D